MPESHTISRRCVYIPITQCAWCRGIKLWRWYRILPWVPILHWYWSFRLSRTLGFTLTVTHSICWRCSGHLAEVRSA